MAKAKNAAVVTAVSYLAKQDCVVFGVYRTAGETFTGEPWSKVYEHDMPEYLEVVEEIMGEPTADAPDEAAPLG